MNRSVPRSRRGRRTGLGVIAAAAVIAGIGLLVAGWSLRSTPDAMPLPRETFQVAARPAAGTATPAVPPSPQSGWKSGVVPPSGHPSLAYPTPNTLYIPGLDIRAPLVPEGAQNGSLVIPGNPKTIGRYTGSPDLPARAGTTVLAGHVTFGAEVGALYALSTIQPRTLIVTTDGQGRAWAWQTIGLDVTGKDDLPAFPSHGPRRLAVVTCGGKVVSTAHGRYYESNVIATAVPIG